jgi:RNA polymerase sigma-70 factor, ECF subfamily
MLRMMTIKAQSAVPVGSTPLPFSDNELMVLVKQGNTAAFELLVDRYKQPVLNFVTRAVGDPTEAQDVAQNVFIQVFRCAKGYQAAAKFTTWLFTIARNLCLNEIRRRSRHPSCPIMGESPDLSETVGYQYEDTGTVAPWEEIIGGELVRHIEGAIAELPEAQRTAILLLCQDDLSYLDIAEVLGITLSATRSLIHRARERLKTKIRPYLETVVPGDSWCGSESFRCRQTSLNGDWRPVAARP